MLHIVAVPLFMLGTVLLLVGLYRASLLLSGLSVACIGISLAVQGRGHKMEAVPPVPFESPANAMSRLLLEQWVTFPRFVLSGGWYENLVRSAKP